MGFFLRKKPRSRREIAESNERTRSEVSSAGQFQRNRTLTGRHTDAVVSTRIHSHSLHARRKKLMTILAGVVLAGIALTILLFQFTARPVVVSSGTTQVQNADEARYDDIINKYLQANPLERFRFALNTAQLLVWLQKDAPEVAAITEVESDGLGVTKYTFALRKPIATWSIGGRQYFVDEEGETFDKNYFNTPSVQVVDNSGATVVEGEAVASNRLLSFVGRLVSLMKEAQIPVTQIEIPEGSTRRLVVHTEGGPRVYVTVDGGVERQVTAASTAIKRLVASGEAATYIDVRANGRVFYK